MTALSVFDLLQCEAIAGGGANPALEARAFDVARQLVEATLSAHAHIDALDRSLAPSKEHEEHPVDRPISALLHAMYEQWASQAVAVLERVREAERSGKRVPRANELRDIEGRVGARLNVTLSDLERARAEIERGEVISGEEVRRELQARILAQRAAKAS